MSEITEIKVYWDVQDPTNEGWAYTAYGEDSIVDSGPIDAEDLDDAIDEAIRILGVDVRCDAFAREPNVDGGYAIWSKVTA